MSNLCRQCLKSISRGGYQIGRRGALCRCCAARATGMTASALKAAFGAKIKAHNSKRIIKRLREQIANLQFQRAAYEALEASMQKRIDFLEDEIATMLDDKATYEREMQKHERK